MRSSSAPTGFRFPTLEPVAPPPPAAPLPADPMQEATSLIAAAHAEAGALREQARMEGMAEGRREGLAAARAELEPAAAALAEAGAGAAALSAELAVRLEGEAVELAVRLAEKIAACALDVRPERIVEVVRGALRPLVERERVVVQIHPDDLALVREAAGDLVDSLGGIQHFDVQGERRVTRGGAVVRTPEGEVDARLETKLERAREVVAAELSR